MTRNVYNQYGGLICAQTDNIEEVELNTKQWHGGKLLHILHL